MTASPAEYALPLMVPYVHEGLGFSIQVPESWHGQLFADARMRLLGPESHDFLAYRPTMDIRAGIPQGQDESWVRTLFDASGAQMALTYPHFQADREEHFPLSSGQVVHVRYYRWRDPQLGQTLVQLQALLLQDAQTLFLVNAATLQPLEAAHMPIFDAVLRSFTLGTGT